MTTCSRHKQRFFIAKQFVLTILFDGNALCYNLIQNNPQQTHSGYVPLVY